MTAAKKKPAGPRSGSAPDRRFRDRGRRVDVEVVPTGKNASEPTTHAVYYRAPDRSEPVSAFIDGLTIAAQVAVDQKIDWLNDLPQSAPPLGFPHTSDLKSALKLRELRCQYNKTKYRIIYGRSDNLFVLLHAIEKSTGPVPTEDIITAEDRFKGFRARMNADPRRPPRAAGHDAPLAKRLRVNIRRLEKHP